jgi:hypothetical protein
MGLADFILADRESGETEPLVESSSIIHQLNRSTENYRDAQRWANWILQLRLARDIRECWIFCREKLPGVEKWFCELERRFEIIQQRMK